MDNKLIDNSSEKLRMDTTIRKCLLVPELERVYMATGYWDLEAMLLIRDELYHFLDREGAKLFLLIGKDPYVYSHMQFSPKYRGKQYPQEYIRTDIDDLDLKEEYMEIVTHLIRYCEEDKVEVRLYETDHDGEPQMMHSKCYIFDGEEFGHGIIGSSNLTERGLRNNAELNYLETNAVVVTSMDETKGVKSHLKWFLEHWDLATDWTKTFLEQVLKPSKLAPPKPPQETKAQIKPESPYELYIWYLIRKLSDIADPRALTALRSYLPEEMQPLSFQLDAVLQCSHIMKRHGGFFLADVVGLGKTVTAMMIVKKFLSENQDPHRPSRVLIITPPAVRQNWESTLALFDKDRPNTMAPSIRILSSGKVAQLMPDTEELDIEEPIYTESAGEEEEEEIDTTEDYGLILIDESHNFRNSWTKKYAALQTLISGIERRVGLAPYIGLLSATPQNNTPYDLRNQIFLFQRTPNRSSLTTVEGGKLDTFFSDLGKRYYELRKLPPEESEEPLRQLAQELRDKVLSELVVRRTRHDIERYYPEDAKLLTFPEVKGPHELYYEFDEKLSRLFHRTVSAILRADSDESQLPIDLPPEEGEEFLGFYRYSAIMFLKDPQHKSLYAVRSLSVETISRRMGTMMRILLVKRLESSISAFKSSLYNLRTYTQNMMDMLDADTVFICPDLDVNQIIGKAGSLQSAIPILEEKMQTKGENNRRYRRDDFDPRYRELLRRDYDLLSELCKEWGQNDYDPKMDAFKECLPKLLDRSINNPSLKDQPKLVIFTEALDTVETIARALTAKGCKALAITAQNRLEKAEEISANFDANYTGEWRNDYTAIVTTEVLAEGVNLHRANVILNFDTPWNSTRLMQQIGRVNRIGSPETEIHVFNFFPTTESEEVLSLVKIAFSKIQSFIGTFGEDSKIYMQTEKLDRVSLAQIPDQDEESPMAPYIAELKSYQEGHPLTYDRLSKMELEHFTGVVKGAGESAYTTLLDPGQIGLLGPSDDPSHPSVVSPLDMMASLKCDPEDLFLTPEEEEKGRLLETEQSALLVGRTFKESMTLNKEVTSKCKKARQILHRHYKQSVKGLPEAAKVYSTVDKALLGNNSQVATQLLQLDSKQGLYSPGEMLLQTFGYLSSPSSTSLTITLHLLHRPI